MNANNPGRRTKHGHRRTDEDQEESQTILTHTHTSRQGDYTQVRHIRQSKGRHGQERKWDKAQGGETSKI